MSHDRGQHFHLGADKRGPQPVHLGVRGGLKVEEVIGRVEPVIDQGLEVVVVPLLLRVDPAAVARCDGLIRVQRGDGEVPERADQLAIVCLRAHGLADVLDEPPAAGPAKLCYSLDVPAGNAVGVTHDHGLHERRGLLQKLLFAGIHGPRCAVAVDGPRADHLHHVGNRHHGEGGHQDVVVWAQVAGQQRHVQCGRARGGGQCHGHLVEPADLLGQAPRPARARGDLAPEHGLHDVVDALPGVVRLQDSVEPALVPRLRLRRGHGLLDPGR
mmetsp:Transcript_26129/g.82935  ORF Transcript_26129/g.82935 Transcript_26129/m.82935 type:complete len:271 (-) Transcript_26129:181-993(-)